MVRQEVRVDVGLGCVKQKLDGTRLLRYRIIRFRILLSERAMSLRFLSPLHKATRQIGLYLEPRCTILGITCGEGHLLSFLHHYAPQSVGQLQRVFDLKPSTLTSMLDRLEKRDLINRAVHPTDRRSWLITPTHEGKRIAADLRVVLDALEADVEQSIAPGDLAGFEAVMAAIALVTGVTVSAEEEP
jgi:DNA-binding MarR family transcriptional regulator